MNINHRLGKLETKQKSKGNSKPSASVVIYTGNLDKEFSIIKGNPNAKTVLYLPDNARDIVTESNNSDKSKR